MEALCGSKGDNGNTAAMEERDGSDRNNCNNGNGHAVSNGGIDTESRDITDGSSNSSSNSRGGGKDGGGNCRDSGDDGGGEGRDGIDGSKSGSDGHNRLHG